jgi:Carbohydrate-binding family 9
MFAENDASMTKYRGLVGVNACAQSACLWPLAAGIRSGRTGAIVENSANSKQSVMRAALPTATAVRISGEIAPQGFPAPEDWNRAVPLNFDRDWRGENPDPQRATEVRILYTDDTLFLRFHQTYRTITVYPDGRPDGWRDELWNHDVAEAFLQPDWSNPRRYKEFEVSPNGFWIDLDISHGEKEELHSRLQRRVKQNPAQKTWTAELAIPMLSVTNAFSAEKNWRVNFYRVEGEHEPRFYSAWSPTYSPQPAFHVPEAFGTLVFR